MFTEPIISFRIEIIEGKRPENRISSGPFGMLNPFDMIARDIFNQISNDVTTENIQKVTRIGPKFIRKPHSHTGVIGNQGQDLASVIVNDIFDNIGADHNNAESNFNDRSSNENVFGQMPILVFKSRKNLKKSDENVNSPMKLFSNLDKMFDSFFDIDNQHAGHEHNNTNVTKDLPDSVKIINIKDITHREEKEKTTKPNNEHKVKELNSNIVKQSQVANSAPIHNENKLTEKKINLEIKEKIVLSNVIPKISKSSYSLKYCLKILTETLLFCFFAYIILLIFKKLTEKEPTLKKGNHSINEIEDELKSMKEKNKLY